MSVLSRIDGDSRLTTTPICRPKLFEHYKKARECFWLPAEIDLSSDFEQFQKLPAAVQKIIKWVLAFFATSDKIVNLNIASRIKTEVAVLEADYFYDFQMMMENIHAEVYADLLNTIVPDPAEREILFNAVSTMPYVASMIEFLSDCINSDAPFGERLLRMACGEGILFQSQFLFIYWFAKMGFMPGLCQSNELIARDENLHWTFAPLIYELVTVDHRLTSERAHEIVRDATDRSLRCCRELLSEPLEGLNYELATPFMKSVANAVSVAFVHEPCYSESESRHALTFMKNLSVPNKTNQFEKKATEYSKVIQYTGPIEVIGKLRVAATF